MKTLRNTLSILVLLALIVSCEDDTDDNGNDNDNNIVEITDDLTDPTVWYADSVYVIKDHDFWVENTLTIQAGTVIKFSTDGMYMNVDGQGTVNAIGTADKPIVFTSFKDDENGGDSNGDAEGTTPTVGDWANITVYSNGSQFDYCEFFYGGGGRYPYTLQFYGAKGSVGNSLFVNNKGGKNGDFYYGVLDIMDADDGMVLNNNVFYNNNLPLSIYAAYTLNGSNKFSNPENPAENNSMNGVFVYDADDIPVATVWEENEVPFVIYSNQLIVEPDAVLQLGANVVLKFTNDAELVLQNGISSLSQSAGNVFTSFKDDTVLGDTNGDGDATSPDDGDWIGIYNDHSVTGSYYFTWSNIFYDLNR